MDPIEIIPRDRRQPKPFRLALLLGMTVLLFFVIYNHYDQIAASVIQARSASGLG
jgi:hypothetical protein